MPGETGLKWDEWKNSQKTTGVVKGGGKDTGLGSGLFNAGVLALDNQEDMAALSTGLAIDIWDPVWAAILAGEM